MNRLTVKKYLGTRAFFRKFLVIAMPIAIQNGITNFVSMLDNLMVGQLGTHQMNGVSIVNQITLIPYLCIFGAMAGAGIFTAQFYGGGDEEGIKYTFRFKLCIGALVVTAAIVTAFLCGRDLVTLFLHSENRKDIDLTMKYALDYLSISMWGFLPFGICQVYVLPRYAPE